MNFPSITCRRVMLLLAMLPVVTTIGCGDRGKSAEKKEASPPAAVVVRLAVVDDPGLAAAARQLRTEWRALTGDTLEVEEWESLPAGEKPWQTDALILPAPRLGELVSTDRILPVPDEVLKSTELAWNDIFEADRQHTAMWGEQAWAIPFGSPVLTLLYRRDIINPLMVAPPVTWQQYQALAARLSDRTKLVQFTLPPNEPWYGTLEPLAGDWAAVTLLARAAAYAKHRDYYSALFSSEDFEPLIDSPPFVQALEELVAVTKGASADDKETGDKASRPAVPRLTPAEVREQFFSGHSALALTWPTAADKTPSGVTAWGLGLAALPGAARSYNPTLHVWEDREAEERQSVPLVPVSGRIGVVPRSSRASDQAFRLLAWLSGKKWSNKVAAASPATTLYRHDQLTRPQEWVEPEVELAVAQHYGEEVVQALSGSAVVDGLRIPGRAEYLAALESAVMQAVEGKQSPTEALHKAADEWREISNRLGKPSQLAAYRQSLGLNK